MNTVPLLVTATWAGVALLWTHGFAAEPNERSVRAQSPRDNQAGALSTPIDIEIPGAVCGNGSPYSIKFRPGRPDRIFAEMQFGGVCWNASTCFGPNFRAIPQGVEKGAFPVGLHWEPRNLAAEVEDATYVYFPYCTGDAFMGSHVAQYGRRQMHHMGYANLKKSAAYLEKSGLVSFPNIDSFTVAGSSAGAIGTLVSLQVFERYLPSTARKVALSDAPGLHFGSQVWKKIGPRFYADAQSVLRGAGMTISADDGNVAQFIPDLCRHHRGWTISILQSSRDNAMSTVFGNTTPWEHERAVYSERGLAGIALPPNCSTWIQKSSNHMFFIPPYRSTRSEVLGLSALEYVRTALQGVTPPRTVDP